MEFLYFLEGLRNPLCDTLFSLITHLGEETVFIVIGILFFWCIDKWEGYYLLTTGLMGTVINQFLKLWFRIPRPWVRDPDFTIVESARGGHRLLLPQRAYPIGAGHIRRYRPLE